MPVQTQMSSFAKKMAGRVAQAHAEHKDKPVDTGNQRLPAGIRNGTAKLSAMYTKEYEDDKNGPGTKGQVFFRASAIALTPEVHNGQKVAGGITQVIIPLCDMPAKGMRKAKSFSENWYEFQNLFKLLGVAPPNETPQTDPTGQRTEAYYFAAMKALVDPQRPKPVIISFSTRGWTPKPTPQQPKPEEMVFEEWHGLADEVPHDDPGAGIADASGGGAQPEPMTQAPTALNPNPTTAPQEQFNEFAGQTQSDTTPPSNNPPVETSAPMDENDAAEVVAALVSIAMDDPNGQTPDGANAQQQLEEMAWKNGWTKEQTGGAADWAAVGDMALATPEAVAATQSSGAEEHVTPMVGSKYKFAKRDKNGNKLKDNKNNEFPPHDIEVLSVDIANRTCTAKTTKDGKLITDIRTKAPVQIKFEWLE